LNIGALTLTCACGRTSEQKAIEPVYDKQTGRLELLKFDANGNGKTDTLSYMDGSRILRIEIDKDEDGKPERWEYYDDEQKLVKVGFSRSGAGKEDAWSFAAPDGTPARIEIATMADGKVRRTEYYEKGAIARAEEDSDGDDVIDKWETYDNAGPESRLASVAFDLHHRGSPDRRLTYEVSGAVLVEVDPDGDGKFVLP